MALNMDDQEAQLSLLQEKDGTQKQVRSKKARGSYALVHTLAVLYVPLVIGFIYLFWYSKTHECKQAALLPCETQWFGVFSTMTEAKV